MSPSAQRVSTSGAKAACIEAGHAEALRERSLAALGEESEALSARAGGDLSDAVGQAARRAAQCAR